MRGSRQSIALGVIVCALLFAQSAYAQATRTWVSGVGDDVNPCSRTAPCKTFAGAISKTAAGGEIDVLDPGGFGAVTITKSITIDGGGGFASVLVSGTNGIIVTAGATDRVVLRNLSIFGSGTGLNGIDFRSGIHLLIQNCSITGFATNGISIASTTASSQTMISNSTVTNNSTGILFSTANATSLIGGVISNSLITHNSGIGISALVPAGKPGIAVVVDRVVSAFNASGIATNGSGASVLMSASTIVGNGLGLSQSNGGTFVSLKNNTVNDNGTDGTPVSGTGPN